MSLDFGVVSVFLAEDPGGFFCFLAGVPLELSGHSHFQAIFKTSDTEVNLLHVFSDGVSRDAKKIEEGGQGKGHADTASFPSGDEGSKPSDICPKGDEVSQRFKRAVVKEMIKNSMAIKRNVPK